MNYSEYGWLSENIGGWGIWDADEEREIVETRESHRRISKQQEQGQILEEDCMDSFFFCECNGKCKECEIQNEYLNLLYCEDRDSCHEIRLDPDGEYECSMCPIGKRKGIEQVVSKEAERDIEFKKHLYELTNITYEP